MEINSHILSSFNEDLELIKKRLVEMVQVVEDSLNSSQQALIKGDISACKEIIADDDIIDDTERLIDNLAMNTLLRYNPVASDLRFVVSSISIAKTLERIGDHASHIAKSTRKIYKSEVMNLDLEYITALFTMAMEQFDYAKKAIATNDIQYAEKCLEGEESMRKSAKKISKIFVNMMSDGATEVSSYLNLILIARSVERISKLSCNISEDIIYIETAQNIREQES